MDYSIVITVDSPSQDWTLDGLKLCLKTHLSKIQQEWISDHHCLDREHNSIVDYALDHLNLGSKEKLELNQPDQLIIQTKIPKNIGLPVVAFHFLVFWCHRVFCQVALVKGVFNWDHNTTLTYYLGGRHEAINSVALNEFLIYLEQYFPSKINVPSTEMELIIRDHLTAPLRQPGLIKDDPRWTQANEEHDHNLTSKLCQALQDYIMPKFLQGLHVGHYLIHKPLEAYLTKNWNKMVQFEDPETESIVSPTEIECLISDDDDAWTRNMTRIYNDVMARRQANQSLIEEHRQKHHKFGLEPQQMYYSIDLQQTNYYSKLLSELERTQAQPILICSQSWCEDKDKDTTHNVKQWVGNHYETKKMKILFTGVANPWNEGGPRSRTKFQGVHYTAQVLSSPEVRVIRDHESIMMSLGFKYNHTIYILDQSHTLYFEDDCLNYGLFDLINNYAEMHISGQGWHQIEGEAKVYAP